MLKVLGENIQVTTYLLETRKMGQVGLISYLVELAQKQKLMRWSFEHKN